MAESDLALIRGWKDALDRLMDILPEDRISLDGFAGDTPTNLLFQDNCHLWPPGARRVAEAIAVEILRRQRR